MSSSIFWNWVINITAEQQEILFRIEDKIQKHENGCFLYQASNLNIQYKKKNISLRPFIYYIFRTKDENNENMFIFSPCSNKACVNPLHLVKTTHFLACRLNKIGWKNMNKSEQEIARLFKLKTLLENGRENDDCLLYTGCRNASGYGVIYNTYVHRLRWKLEHPEMSIDNTTYVRHKCKNRHCFNIEHLEIGTARNNALDRKRDNTQQFGANHHSAKISEDIAQKIKNSKGDGIASERSQKYGVSIYIITDIDRGKTWRHLPLHDQPNFRKDSWCEKKYEAEQRLKERVPTEADYKQLWKRVEKNAKESLSDICNDVPCLLYEKLNIYGYGRTYFVGRRKNVHVLVWEYFHNASKTQEDITLVVRHLCGNSACIQPSHLRLGTKKENMNDKRKHGTMPGISEAQGHEIIKLKEEGFKPTYIANRLKIRRDTVHTVVYKKGHLYLQNKK